MLSQEKQKKLAYVARRYYLGKSAAERYCKGIRGFQALSQPDAF
mgnify:CR=1 FL=1